MKRLILTTIGLLVFSSEIFSFPKTVAKQLDVGITQQATGGMAISSKNRYMMLAYTDNLKIVDLATFALAADQPPALSKDDGTDGNIKSIAFLSLNSSICAAQDDGDLLTYDLNAITNKPTSNVIASGKSLGPVENDEAGLTSTLYIANSADGIIYVTDSTVSTTPTAISIRSGTDTSLFTVNSMFFDSTTGEIYASTNTGKLIYTTGGAAGVLALDTTGTANIIAMAGTTDGAKIYIVDATNNMVRIFSTSSHTQSSTPITINTTDNNNLTSIVLMHSDIDNKTYGYVSGQRGISVIDTSNDTLIDVDDSTSTAIDPIPTTDYGPMVVSGDGYVFLSSGSGKIDIVTEKPWVTVSDVAYKDSTGAVTDALKVGGTVTITFQSSITGTFQVVNGGEVNNTGGKVITTTDASSSVTADTDTQTTFAYDTNSSAFDEGINTTYIFVTDASHTNMVGRMAASVLVDTPPPATTISSTGFGNTRAYINFARLTPNDMSYYNLYADTDAENVKTKVDRSGSVSQTSAGTTISGEIGGLTNGTKYYVAVEGVDNNGNVGPRTWQLADGTQAFANPQETVGPAEFAGEDGGCSLIKGLKDEHYGVYVIILGLGFLIVVRILKRSRKASFATTLLIFLFAIPAHAKDAPSQWWSFEVKAGFWMPTASKTKKFFDSCCNIVSMMEGGFLYKNKYGVELGAGIMNKSGNAKGITTGDASQDSFNLFTVPMETSLVWRADYFQNQIVVPYIKGGVDYVFYREHTQGRPTVKGLKTGLHAVGGLQFLLTVIDSDASMELDYGVKGPYLITEARYNWINGFGGKGLDLSGMIYSAGLLFEF